MSRSTLVPAALSSKDELSLEELDTVAGGKPKVDVAVEAKAEKNGNADVSVTVTIHF